MRILILILISISSFAQDVVPAFKVKPTPAALGRIIYDDFSTNTISNYTQNFATSTASISGGDLNLTAGNVTFNNSISFTDATNAHSFTALKNWSFAITGKIAFTPTTTSYGLYLGRKSTNTSVTTDYLGNANFGSDGVQLGIHSLLNGSRTVMALSSLGSAVALNDEFLLRLSRNDLTYKMVFQNLTTGYADSITYSQSISYGSSTYLENTGNFAIYSLSNHLVKIHDFTVTSQELKNQHVLFVGNSITAGQYGGGTTSRYQYVCMNGSSRSNSFLAGPGDKSAEVLSRVKEIIALSPRWVSLEIGTNDIGSSISSSVWQANILSIVNQLRAAGIGVIICTPPASADGIADIKTYFLSAFSKDWYVDLHAVTKSGSDNTLGSSFNSGDGVHPNSAGMSIMGNTIKSTVKAIFY